MPAAGGGRRDSELIGAGAVTESHPLWSSGFRPFFLVAAIYGPLSLALSFGNPSVLWHAHEMLFGFAAALVCASLLTALPSWSGAREVRGGRLAALFVLWAAAKPNSISCACQRESG